MKILCVIPARIGSTRLPRKALIKIGDIKPMVQMTYEAASTCKDIDELVVATDDNEIATVIKSAGGKVVMTDSAIKTGSDRVAAVAEQYNDVDVVVNLQGDEPFIKPEMLSALVQPYLSGENPDMTTLAAPLYFSEKYNSPDAVKVIFNKNYYAIYFSRSPLPYFRTEVDNAPVLHHMGVYAFRYDFLMKYTKLPQTKLELAESLEQLRVLEHGYNIKVCPVAENTLEINNAEELELAHARYREEALV